MLVGSAEVVAYLVVDGRMKRMLAGAVMERECGVGGFGDVKLVCENLVLRTASDEDAATIGEICHGLLVPEFQHFLPFDEPAESVNDARERMVDRVHGERASFRFDCWSMTFAVVVDGRVVGMQRVHANNFDVLGVVNTSSRLARDIHGGGVGSGMRAMTLEFVFGHLGAKAAYSSYVDGNVASRRVSKKLGYRHVGIELVPYLDSRVINHIVCLSRGDWVKVRGEWLDDMDIVVFD